MSDIQLSDEPVGSVQELANAFGDRLLESMWGGGECLMPWCRDVRLDGGAHYKMRRDPATMVVQGDQVWRIVNGPGEMLVTQFEEIVYRPEEHERPPVVDNELYHGFASVNYIEAVAHKRTCALAQAGCSHVVRYWRLLPVLVNGVTPKEWFVYAEVAFVGQTL